MATKPYRVSLRTIGGASADWWIMKQKFASLTEAHDAIALLVETSNYFEEQRRSTTRMSIRYIHEGVYELTKTDASRLYRPPSLYAAVKVIEVDEPDDGIPTPEEALARLEELEREAQKVSATQESWI